LAGEFQNPRPLAPFHSIMDLPSRQDINVHNSLDEQTACEHFFGKSLKEAEALFRENSLHYQEDLMFMGARGFRFYVEAAIDYIQSPSASGDSDMVNCFAGLLEYRLKYEADELRPIAEKLASICGYILDHYDRFEVIPEIYGDLRPHFIALRRQFLSANEFEL
jgi:hypothetical protein